MVIIGIRCTLRLRPMVRVEVKLLGHVGVMPVRSPDGLTLISNLSVLGRTQLRD